MAKKRNGRRKQGDSSPNEEDDHGDEKSDTQETETATTTTTEKEEDIDFAQRRELQRKIASDKRRARQRCHLCGKAGHVRRQCPRVIAANANLHLGGGRGSSSEKMHHHVKEGGAAATATATISKGRAKHGEAALFPELPIGFSANNRQEITKYSEDDDATLTGSSLPTPPEEAFKYYDASCDIMATIEYLRFGRGSKNNKLSNKEASDVYQTAIETASASSNYGGCISRCLVRPGRPWTASSIISPLNRNDEWCVVGLGRDFLYNDTESESVMVCLLETLSGNEGIVVGFCADLDYTPEMLHRPGCDRDSQLRRLSCTCHAAGEANVAIQIRASPGVVSSSSSARSGEDDNDSDDSSYVRVMKDLLQILKETTAKYPLLKVHLSCWSGGADRMMSLLQAFPENLYFGFDATVSFAKASHIHECAFDVPLSKVVLEIGANTIPTVVARSMGRDAFSHSGLIPFVAAALAAIKGNGTTTAEHVARMATQNTLKLYPQLLAASTKVNRSDS